MLYWEEISFEILIRWMIFIIFIFIFLSSSWEKAVGQKETTSDECIPQTCYICKFFCQQNSVSTTSVLKLIIPFPLSPEQNYF